MILLLLSCTEAAAQVRVEGTVRWQDGSPATGLTIAIPDLTLTATTDALGRYTVNNITPGVRASIDVVMNGRLLAQQFSLLTLAVERVDFQLPGTPASPVLPAEGAGQETLGFGPDGEPILSSSVTVVATLPMLSASTEAGKVRLTPDQVATLPSLGTRDIFRALQWLPGISSNETSSGLFVRGGTPDQNLVDYDGFTVYSVDHLFGYFSAFNMDAIESVDVSKGAYDARFGGRLSSVTEVRGKARSDTLRGSVGASLLSADGVLEAPLGAKASFLVGYRRSYQGPLYDRILGLVNSQSGPRASGRLATLFSSQPRSSFDDMNGRFEYRPSSRDRVVVSAFMSNDDVDNSRNLQFPAEFAERLAARGLSASGISITDVRDLRNTGLSVRWSRDWNSRVRMTATFGRSDFDALTERTSNLANRQGGTGELNVVDDTAFKVDVPILLSSSQELSIGAQHTTHRADYQFANSFALPAASTATPVSPLTSQLNRATTGDALSVYAQHRLSLGSRVFATPGIRVTEFSLTGDRLLEPRVTATALLTDTLRIKGAWGRNHQFVNRLVREDVLQGNRAFWALSDGAAIPVSSSTNASIGATHETTRFLVDAEVFARDLSDISQLAPRVIGATDNIDLSQFFYRGSGKAKGLEVLGQRKVGRHTGLASYTWSGISYDFPNLGEPFPADHDRTHELKLIDTARFGQWTFTGTWIYSTGLPYTEPIGTESIIRQGPLGEVTFERIVVGDKNGARLPAYHRLDLAANYGWRFGDRRTATISVSAFNAYNRSNVWYKEFTTVEGEIVENNIGLMKLTLNASLSIRF